MPPRFAFPRGLLKAKKEAYRAIIPTPSLAAEEPEVVQLASEAPFFRHA